jgi:hypothetical protein
MNDIPAEARNANVLRRWLVLQLTHISNVRTVVDDGDAP